MTLTQQEIWVCFTAIRCSDIWELSQPMAPAYVSRSSYLKINLTLVPQSPVTISSRTGTRGPRPLFADPCFTIL